MQVYFALTISALGVSQTAAFAPDTNKAKDSVASIFEIIDSKPKIDSSSNEGTTLATVNGGIEFKRVSFKYPTRPDVQIFRDLCLTIPSGKVITNTLMLFNDLFIYFFTDKKNKAFQSMVDLRAKNSTETNQTTTQPLRFKSKTEQLPHILVKWKMTLSLYLT